MDEFLIDGKILTNIADKIRENLNKGLVIDSGGDGNGLLEPGVIQVYYKEFIDYSEHGDYDGIIDGNSHGDTFLAFGALKNNRGETVPVLYDTSTEDYEDPDYEEPWFYEGVVEVDGIPYDKWRKIETGENATFTWDFPAQQYVYTNLVVKNVTELIQPENMPNKIDEVYDTGRTAGYGEGRKSAIISVGELPSIEEADANALYKCGDNYYKKAKIFEDIYVYADGRSISTYRDEHLTPDDVCSFYYVKSMPQTFADTDHFEYHFFYVEDEGGVYYYHDGDIVSVSFSGVVDSIDNIDYEGNFPLIKDGWAEFILTNGTKRIEGAGVYGVSGYEFVEAFIPPEYVQPYTVANITKNGSYDAVLWKDAIVNVPPPEGYLHPEGRTTLTDNGVYDVSKFAEAEVIVPTGGASFTVEGKAIPINEHVERIYFNINNSVEETDAILSKLTYIENVFENPTAFVYGDTTDGYTGLFIGAWKFDDTHYAIGFFDNLESMSGEILYATPGFIGNDESRYNGWLKQGYAPLDLTFNSMGVYGSSIPEFLGFPIGSENELVKNVLSVVPFAAPSNNVATEGTPIPRGEVVEKIYFNTNNTAEETLAILSQLTYIQTPLVPYPINVIYGNTADGVTGSVIYAIKYSDTEIAIQELQNINSQNFLVLFNSDSTTLRGAGFNGWNFATVLGFNPGSARRNEEVGIHSMNVYAGGQALTDFNGIPIGVENEKLKNVLSITPFAVASSKEDFEGTAIISGETVEKVYFNINNTMEETNEILSQLTYVQTPFLQYPIYPIFAYVDPNGNGYTGKFIFAVNTGYYYEINYCEDIANQNFVYLYATQFSDNYEGWSYCNTIGDVAAEGVPAFIELNVAGSSEWGGLTVGAENDKIKNVLSLTPFVNGYDKGYNDGIEQSKQAQYDAFWDVFQDNGNRTDYRFAFYGRGWNDDTYNPKYDIVCAPTTLFPTMFADAVFGYSEISDTKVSIDLTQATSCGSFFSECTKLVTVRKLIVAETTLMNTVFGYNPSLKNVTIEGTIGTNCVIRYSSQLTTESVDSIINALKDLTGQTAQTLTFHATVKGKLTDAQKSAITAKNWQLG